LAKKRAPIFTPRPPPAPPPKNPSAPPPRDPPQDLYDSLRKLYPKPPRISGLAMVDHVAAAQSKHSW